MEIKFEDICKANELINTVELKGKNYAEVKERVKAFRYLYPNGSIQTELLKADKDEIIFKAMAYDENLFLLATGYARGKANKFFALEDTETSAVGRCLGFLCLGISASLASAEEIQDANDKEIFDEPTVADLANEFQKLYSVQQQTEILNRAAVLKPEDLGSEILSKYVNFKKYGKK